MPPNNTLPTPAPARSCGSGITLWALQHLLAAAAAGPKLVGQQTTTENEETNVHQDLVNIPVRDLGRSMEFFTALGFSFDQRFCDENAACLSISDDIYVMLLVEPFFKSFTGKDVVDATKSTEAIVALGVSAGRSAQLAGGSAHRVGSVEAVLGQLAQRVEDLGVGALGLRVADQVVPAGGVVHPGEEALQLNRVGHGPRLPGCGVSTPWLARRADSWRLP